MAEAAALDQTVEPWTAYNTSQRSASDWKPSEGNATNSTLPFQPSPYDAFVEVFAFYLWNYITPTVFGIILFVGVTGNTLVLYVIASRREMRSITNLMLVNLAVADLAYLFVCVPFNMVKYIAETWSYGDTACQIGQYFLYVTAYVTIYTLVAISAFRYATVVGTRATMQYRTKTNAVIVAVGIWLVILVANIPTWMAHSVKNFQDTDFWYCAINDDAVLPVYLSFFVVGYALPLLIISVLYTRIVSHLSKHTPSTVDQSRMRERNARTLRVVVLVVVVFGVSWLPTHLQALIGYFTRLPSGIVYEVFRILWTCMMFGNSCANPIIYNYGSTEFRKCFREVCRKCCCCFCKKSMDEGDFEASGCPPKGGKKAGKRRRVADELRADVTAHSAIEVSPLNVAKSSNLVLLKDGGVAKKQSLVSRDGSDCEQVSNHCESSV